MRRLTLPAATVMFLLTIVPTAWAQTADAGAPAQADIKRLLELTGSDKVGPMMASLVAGQLLQQVQQQHPEVPARAIEIVRSTLDEEFKGAFGADGPVMRDIGAIWSKHFTGDEIRGLIAFYETPLGRKVVDTLPVIMQEASQAGVSWAQQNMPDISKKVQDRLRAEGLIK